jgi:hypothetical protein
MRAAMPSAHVLHVERERVLAEIEERLGLGPNLFKGVVDFSLPPPQAIVPVVDGAADRRQRGVELCAGVAQGDERIYIARV